MMKGIKIALRVLLTTKITQIIIIKVKTISCMMSHWNKKNSTILNYSTSLNSKLKLIKTTNKLASEQMMYRLVHSRFKIKAHSNRNSNINLQTIIITIKTRQIKMIKAMKMITKIMMSTATAHQLRKINHRYSHRKKWNWEQAE